MRNVAKGSQVTRRGDTRITGFGKIIRLLKIDEIPQLINIIRGEMSFIGPRPEVPDYVNRQKFSFLNVVKPGLTDFSSIIFRNEESILNSLGTDESYERTILPIKLELAKLYAQKQGLWVDSNIFLVTIISILFPRYAQILIYKKYIQNTDVRLEKDIQSLLKL